MEEIDKNGVHRTHCCVHHGCKYGDEDCVIKNGIQIQTHSCELCEEEDREYEFIYGKEFENLIMKNFYNNTGDLPDPGTILKQIKNIILGREN